VILCFQFYIHLCLIIRKFAIKLNRGRETKNWSPLYPYKTFSLQRQK